MEKETTVIQCNYDICASIDDRSSILGKELPLYERHLDVIGNSHPYDCEQEVVMGMRWRKNAWIRSMNCTTHQ